MKSAVRLVIPRWRRAGARVGTTCSLVIVCALVAGACTSEKQDQPEFSAVPTLASNRVLRIAYLQKQGNQQYFVDQAAGARAEAARLGNVEVIVVDVGANADVALAELDKAIAEKVDGIAIVVPDQLIGPQVIEKASVARIPLLASDDVIKDSSGEAAPFVGFDGKLMGQKVGEHAAKLVKAAGWRLDETRIITAWKQDLSVCTDRVDGARAAFTDAMGASVTAVELDTENTPETARRKTEEAIRERSGVRHWVVWGCNDENTTGVVSALAEAGINAADIISVGINADLSCRDWRAGRNTGNKASLFIAAQDIGATAVTRLVDKIRYGKELPPKTIGRSTIVDASNWRAVGVPCR